jgi:hypothetical protein
MKRDWDLIRKQLTAIEEEKSPIADLPDKPVQDDLPWDIYDEKLKEHKTIENRIFGHLELLIDAGYIDGLDVRRSSDGHFAYGECAPRLTMAGHDLLSTMRSDNLWQKIKETAKAKGVELTFAAIKTFAEILLKG